jgi:hypothetical protein
MRRLSMLVLIPLFAAGLKGQIATTTALVGTVADSTGKVVPNATVTAVETGTQDTYKTLTNDVGYYSIQFVRVGRYQITVEQPGFKRVTKTGIPVEINQTVRTDFMLEVGAVTQTVTVEAAATAIKTDDATVSEVLGTRAVAELPLSFRDPMQLALTTPGVLQTDNSLTGVPPGQRFIGAGTRAIDNDMSLDGISIINNLISTTPTRPMVEAVQEVEVQTGTYSAQYGSYMGVHINSITKSGTNALHGALVEFVENNKLNARNFFTQPTKTNPTAQVTPLHQNQFGFELDGPVFLPKVYNGKDKTFFMASYEGFRLVKQTTSLSSEIPQAFFSGDFSGVSTPIKDPLNGGAVFAGNMIPATRISPVALKLQQYFPSPNILSTGGFANNLSVPVATTVSTNQTLDRIDQNIGGKVRLYVRAYHQDQPAFGGSAIPVNSSTTPTVTSNYSIGYTHTISANMVNDFRVGRYFFDSATVNPFTVGGNKNAGTALGIPGFNGDSAYGNPGLPDFNITGFNGISESGTNWYQNDSTNQFSDQLSWTHGAHNVVAGFEFSRLATGRAAVNSARGAFNFNGTLTGYAPADFILGTPQTFTTPGPEWRGRVAEWRDGFFVQDKWQISQKLTLNYGIRYELPTVPYTINGIATELNRDNTALVGGTPGFHFTDPQHSDWAPRLGLAYRFTDKWVFRAGGGIYYNPNQTNNFTLLNTNPPYTSILNCTWSTGLDIPTLGIPFVPGVCPAAAALGLIVTDPWNQPTPRMNQWSAGLERQLWNGSGIELQYLGSHSYHLDRSYYNNTPLPGPGPVNSRRPNPKFSDIRTFAMDEIANYESMTVNFHQRAARGLMLNASYTWAHTLDVSTDSNSGGTPMNPYWWRADYGNASWDIRHRVLITFAYDIPFFQTHSALVKGAFGGWQANGIITLQTGTPINVTTGTDTANTSAHGSYRPDLTGTPSDNCGSAHLIGCIDNSAYSLANLYPANPSGFRYGNEGRDLLYGPGMQAVNFSLFKNFPIKERMHFQFRFETFGLFNHPNFNNPSSTFGTSSFGNITSSTGERVIQLGSKLIF